MGFHEVQFPTSISYGSRGGPTYSTNVVRLASGYRQAVARWSRPMWAFNVKHGVKTQANISELLEFYICRQGPANSFRYKDALDWTTGATHIDTYSFSDQQIQGIGGETVGDGIQTQWQLLKRYESGSQSIVRPLQKPVSSQVKVGINGAEKQPTDPTYPWSVDTTTGIILFGTAPPVSSIVTAGCQFDVPVCFADEMDTTMMATIEAYDAKTADDIILVEDPQETAIDEDFYGGGAKNNGTLSTNATISPSNGRVQAFGPSAAGKKVYLPDATNLQGGGPHFYIVNTSGSYSFAVCTSDDTTVATVAASSMVIIVISVDGSGNKTWWGLS